MLAANSARWMVGTVRGMIRFRRSGLHACWAILLASIGILTGSSQAFAEAPEYGRCIKVTAGTGKYSSASCTTPGGEKKYEWYPAFGGGRPLAKTHFTLAIKATTEATFETLITRSKLTCTGETGSGELIANKLSRLALTFTGCRGQGEAAHCKGTWTTGPMERVLGVEKTSTEGPIKNKIAAWLYPEGGEAEGPSIGQCGSLGVSGGVLNHVASNSMQASTTIKYAQKAGRQKPEEFEGGLPHVLLFFEENSFGEGWQEQAGLALTMIQTNEEKVEVNSTV
jgi:hypothetical protein